MSICIQDILDKIDELQASKSDNWPWYKYEKNYTSANDYSYTYTVWKITISLHSTPEWSKTSIIVDWIDVGGWQERSHSDSYSIYQYVRDLFKARWIRKAKKYLQSVEQEESPRRPWYKGPTVGDRFVKETNPFDEVLRYKDKKKLTPPWREDMNYF